MSHYFFVYGTLRAGLRLNYNMKRATYVGGATLKGSLYDTGTYPALCMNSLESESSAASTTAEVEIIGEIFSGDDELLKLLDEVEGYYPDNAEIKSLYIRHLVNVTCTSDEKGNPVSSTRPAFVYIYNYDIASLVPIPGGDYKAYLEQKVIPMTITRDDVN